MSLVTSTPTKRNSAIRNPKLSWLFSWFHFGMDDFGVRRQSGSGDGAFERTGNHLDAKDYRACESGVALRLPPQSKTTSAFRMPQGQRGAWLTHEAGRGRKSDLSR